MNEIRCIKTGLDILTPYFGMRADLYTNSNGDYVAKGYKDHTIQEDNHDKYFVKVDAGEIIDDQEDFVIIQFGKRFANVSEDLKEYFDDWA